MPSPAEGTLVLQYRCPEQKQWPGAKPCCGPFPISSLRHWKVTREVGDVLSLTNLAP